MTDLLVEKEKLQKRLKGMDYYELRYLLKQMEHEEFYEVCALVQKQIDELINRELNES